MSTKDKIVAEAERIEEDAIHSAKAHFAQAERWKKFHLWVGALAALLAVVAGGTGLSAFDGGSAVTAAAAFLAAFLTAALTFFDPRKHVQIHSQCGNRYLALRNRARIFCEIECGATDDEDRLIGELKHLAEDRDGLNSDSPVIPRWAYEKAKRGIEAGEATYKTASQR